MFIIFLDAFYELMKNLEADIRYNQRSDNNNNNLLLDIENNKGKLRLPFKYS